MGVPTSEVGYTSATAENGDHEVHKGLVVALGKCNNNTVIIIIIIVSRVSVGALFNTVVYAAAHCRPT
jgi:hypothetical protein